MEANASALSDAGTAKLEEEVAALKREPEELLVEAAASKLDKNRWTAEVEQLLLEVGEGQAKIDKEVAAYIDESAKAALAAPGPDVSELLTDVYSSAY